MPNNVNQTPEEVARDRIDDRLRAAGWHDLGKAHCVFQDTMQRGLDRPHGDEMLAKTVSTRIRHKRPYFRHELASALALLAHDEWSREADLVAYLIAAHHGKVRMNLRALPRERSPSDKGRQDVRFARGVWEGDRLPPVPLANGEDWAGGALTLAVMELGLDEVTRESWTERTRDLLDRFGPFDLAWMETLVRVADWRASAREQKGEYGD
jgi:CRISPR-associated endonuclease/helicase Cas3